MNGGFTLDPRLTSDTLPLAEWPLCAVRLMNDARFPWIVLVPRVADASEIFDLPEAQAARLWRETEAAARSLARATGALKINVGALGNIVRQLHVHVVARGAEDAAWPGPVWGSGPAQLYTPDAAAALSARLLTVLTAP